MAILEGTYYYRGKIPYHYKISVYDANSYRTLDFNIELTNAKGETRIANWNFRSKGIEQAIKDYIEMLIEVKKKK